MKNWHILSQTLKIILAVVCTFSYIVFLIETHGSIENYALKILPQYLEPGMDPQVYHQFYDHIVRPIIVFGSLLLITLGAFVYVKASKSKKSR